MKQKQRFIDVVRRINIVNDRIKNNPSISDYYKKGFDTCLQLLESNCKEVESFNLELENKKLSKQIEELEYETRRLKNHILELNDKLKGKHIGVNLQDITLNINGFDITLKSNVPESVLEGMKKDITDFVLSGKNKSICLNRYTNKAINYLQSQKYIALSL